MNIQVDQGYIIEIPVQYKMPMRGYMSPTEQAKTLPFYHDIGGHFIAVNESSSTSTASRSTTDSVALGVQRWTNWTISSLRKILIQDMIQSLSLNRCENIIQLSISVQVWIILRRGTIKFTSTSTQKDAYWRLWKSQPQQYQRPAHKNEDRGTTLQEDLTNLVHPPLFTMSYNH